MPVKVASISPVRAILHKPLYWPQRVWFTPPVPKGSPPFVLWFNDDIVQQNCYRAFGQFGEDPKPAHEVAQAFVDANTSLPFCHAPDMMPGLWIVGSLGQNEEFTILGASNTGATMLQLDHSHNLNSTGEITISGAIGLWAVLNGKWPASPAAASMVSVPIDSRSFGDFANGGLSARVSIKRELNLAQEAEIMRKPQDRWLARCLQDARFLWNRDKSNHRHVDLHHISASWFRVEGEDWQTVMDSSTTVKCRYCQKAIPIDAATCAYCQNISNPAVHAKLKLEEEQALKVEKQRLKEAQDEINRKLREMNRQAEDRANAEAMTEEATIG